MVDREIAKANLSKRRFEIRKIEKKRWEEDSQYAWEVVDLRGEVKPLKAIFQRDAAAIVKRLNRQHRDAALIARNSHNRDRS